MGGNRMYTLGFQYRTKPLFFGRAAEYSLLWSTFLLELEK
jgi:hypothetical protein